MSRPPWQIRVEDCIVDVMSVGFNPVFWHTDYDAKDVSKHAIIIEALSDDNKLLLKKSDDGNYFFAYAVGKPGRPFLTLIEAKKYSYITLLTVQPINDSYKRSVTGMVADKIKSRKDLEDLRAIANSTKPESDWDKDDHDQWSWANGFMHI